jgi:hypothetical protein
LRSGLIVARQTSEQQARITVGASNRNRVGLVWLEADESPV